MLVLQANGKGIVTFGLWFVHWALVEIASVAGGRGGPAVHVQVPVVCVAGSQGFACAWCAMGWLSAKQGQRENEDTQKSNLGEPLCLSMRILFCCAAIGSAETSSRHFCVYTEW